LHTQLLSVTGTITSSGGGVFASTFVDNITGSSDWASCALLYAEYRILGVRMEYFPWNRYSKTTTISTPLIAVVDRGGTNTVLASYDAAMQYASAKKKSLEDPWIMEARMNGVEDAGFLVTTSGTTLPFTIKVYADGLSITTTYGRYFFYWLVQFRGRK